MLLAYGGRNQYRVWNPIRKDVIVSRDVLFDEHVPSQVAIINIGPGYDDVLATSDELEDKGSKDETEDERESEPEAMIPSSSGAEDQPAIRRSSRITKGQDKRIPFHQEVWDSPRLSARIARVHYIELEPATYEDAVTYPQFQKQWEQAILDEYDALIKNGTWTLTTLPEGRQAISYKWIFKHKLNQAGEVIRFKARLVARGFRQAYGIDYLDTFTPVAKLASLRILLTIAAMEDLEIHQMDIVTAFLLGDLEEHIYMDQPEGFEQEGKDGERLVYKVRRGLYGLKQSARNWYRKLRRYLESIGFIRCHADHCIYFNSATGVIIAVWVDDLTILGRTVDIINSVKKNLTDTFEMKDLGELEYFLGIQVIRDRAGHGIHINQSRYISMILNRFSMLESNPVSAPMAIGTVLHKSIPGDRLIDAKVYQSIVGSQMYAMLGTRPDIAFTIS
jgi:Reverse transcriptase (RNA-dependent DNA polymerase)